jgi:hypothetical protein
VRTKRLTELKMKLHQTGRGKFESLTLGMLERAVGFDKSALRQSSAVEGYVVAICHSPSHRSKPGATELRSLQHARNGFPHVLTS